MVDIKKALTESFNLLRHNKITVFPVLCSAMIPLILIFLFLSMSGLSPLLKELSSASDEFNRQKTGYLLDIENIREENYTTELVNYANKDSDNSTYNNEFSKYLEHKGYDWGRYKQLVNARNINLLVIFILIWIIFSIYLASMAYAMIILAIHKKEISMNSLFRATNRFLLRLLSFKILISLIITIPILIVIGMIILSFMANAILGIFSLILLIMLLLALLIFLGLRLFFALPSMYMDDLGAVKSIRHSFDITKGRLKDVLIVFIVLYAISIVINSSIAQPMFNIYSSLLFGDGWIMLKIMGVLFFVVLHSLAITFEYIFLFYAYIDLKESIKTLSIKK